MGLSNEVIYADLAVHRAQADHVIDIEGFDDGVAVQLGCVGDARRVLLCDQLALRKQRVNFWG